MIVQRKHIDAIVVLVREAEAGYTNALGLRILPHTRSDEDIEWAVLGMFSGLNRDLAIPSDLQWQHWARDPETQQRTMGWFPERPAP